MLENKKIKIKNMSKGMGQNIRFIVTIVHDPKLRNTDDTGFDFNSQAALA